MKRSNLLLLLVISLVACQPKVDRFTLNGQITEAEGQTLYLEHMALDKVEPVDSIQLDADGQFNFSPVAPSESFEFYRLRVGNKVINLSVDSTEVITVKACLPLMQFGYTVEGSENCSVLRALVLRQMELQQDINHAISNYRSPDRTRLDEQITELIDVFKSDVLSEFIMPNPGSAYSYYALFVSINGQMLFNPQTDRQDAKCFAAVATHMDLLYPDALRTTHLHNVALKGMAKTSPSKQKGWDEETIQKFESLIEQVGLIEIELPDNKGKLQKLSDSKGQVILLDFTAFKTDFSPNYNMMLRRLYDKYASQGFNIYQVSVDADESYWLNSSISLPWVCVYDEASLESFYLKSYNVSRLPTVFLIDRGGNIVDRPETTDELESKIEKLLR